MLVPARPVAADAEGALLDVDGAGIQERHCQVTFAVGSADTLDQRAGVDELRAVRSSG